ncbi:MAG: hypothetical protein ACIARR_10235 [Phycisphaerales bacterium JB059]
MRAQERDVNAGAGPPPPRERVDEGSLPHALTFFLSVDERRAVVRRLRRVDRDRTRALLRLLGLDRE